MDLQQIAGFLQATLDPSSAQAAQEQLKLCDEMAGFPSSLLQIAMSEADMGPRQAASVYLKNVVVKSYKVREGEPGESLPFTLADRDKVTLRDNIVESIIAAPPLIRAQLIVCVDHMVKQDFPEKWPALVDKIVVCLSSDKENTWFGAISCAYQIVKKYRFKDLKDAAPMHTCMEVLLPLLLRLFLHLLPNQSEESATLQKLILKLFHRMIELHLPSKVFTDDASFQQWMEIFTTLMKSDVPAVANEEEDEEERARLVWWKLRRWSAGILDMLFDRYGCPLKVRRNYKHFAQHYCQKYNTPVLESLLVVLQKEVAGQFVAPQVLFYIFSYLVNGVKHAQSWKKVLQPHAEQLVAKVLFPMFCYTDSDDELFQEDPYEYIRLHYDLYEEYTSPKTAAGNFLATMCQKRKGIATTTLAFCNAILCDQQSDDRQKDGALHMIGLLKDVVLKKKELKSHVEQQLFQPHIFAHFNTPHGFVRARACWMLRQFSAVTFSDEGLRQLTVFILRCTTQEKDLPVKIEAAMALKEWLLEAAQSEQVVESLRGEIISIVGALLDTLRLTHNEELTEVLEVVMKEFSSEIKNVAAELAQQLVSAFLLIIKEDDQKELNNAQDEADSSYRVLTAMGILDNLKVLPECLEDPEIILKVEEIVYPLIEMVLEQGSFDFYEEIFDLTEMFIGERVSPRMWMVYELFYKHFQEELFDYYYDMLPSFYQFLTVDKAAFAAVPARLQMLVEMSQKTIEQGGDTSASGACRLMEVAVMQMRDNFTAPMLAGLSKAALDKLAGATDSPDLRCSTQHLVLAFLYCHPAVLPQVLEQLHPNLTSKFIAQWLEDTSIYTTIHGHKLSVMTTCELFKLPAASRAPAVLSAAPILIPKAIAVFVSLTKLYEKQRQRDTAALESSDEESEAEESDDEEELDDETDDLDAEDPDHDPQVVDYDSIEDSLDWLVTAIDDEESENMDAYNIFVNVMNFVERCDPEWYSVLVSKLDASHQTQLHEIIILSQQRANERESQRIEAAGGFDFNVQEVAKEVPMSFNFGSTFG